MMKNIVHTLVLCLLFVAACTPTKIFIADERVSYHRMKTADTLTGDPSVEKLIAPYRSKLEVTMNEVIGQAAQELTHATPEGLMGNWAADLIHRQTEAIYGKKIDFTLLNQSGLRIKSIAKGDVTRSKMYELMPFDNQITVLQGSGADVEKLFQTVVAKGGWPISHATCEIHPMPDAPLAKNIRIGGEPLQQEKIYTFALPDYIANGGDNTQLSGLKRTDLNKLMRDAFIEGVQKEKILDAKLEGRIIVVNH
ncbi:MAG: 5'-nucleotidase C-terminal domain-containing protein [Saprospiraceae bacterium]|nr:5'-nucleotidase C-terminal domain-containing protein [Saprospiraceae bacterium]